MYCTNKNKSQNKIVLLLYIITFAHKKQTNENTDYTNLNNITKCL